MDINFQGSRVPTPIDAKPAADRSPGTALVVAISQAQIGNEPGTPLSSLQLESTNAEIDREGLGQAVSNLQAFAQSIQRDLSFSLDDASGRVVIEVRDQASGDVIRQIPSEEALKLMKHLEEARSLLFHETA